MIQDIAQGIRDSAIAFMERIRSHLRPILAVVLGIVVALLLAYSILYTIIFSKIKALVAINAAQIFGIRPEVADWAGGAIAIAVTGYVIWQGMQRGWRVVLGKVQVTEVVFVVVGVCVIAAAILFAKADWRFDDKGRPISYVCPATAPGEPPRVQFTAADPLLGEQCPPIDRKVAAVILSIRRGVVPQPVQINSLAEFEALEFFDRRSGLPVIFSGIPYPDSSGRPRFFRGAGYDPGIGGLLDPPTPEMITAAHAYFVEMDRKRNEENERLAKETTEREARLEAQRQTDDKNRRAESERRAVETARASAAPERKQMTPQEPSVGERKAALPGGTRVTENDFVFTVQSCQRSGRNLTCLGSIASLYKSPRHIGISAKIIDNENEEYNVSFIQIGNRRVPGYWSNSYVNLEPSLTVKMTLGAEGGSLTASTVSLVLQYGAQLGYPQVGGATPGYVSMTKVYLRNIPVASQ